MELNIVNCIIDALQNKGKCGIEGLGSFVLSYENAHFEKAKTVLVPPTKTIQFTEKVDTSYLLQDALRDQFPLNEAKATKAVTLFANKVINGLLNFDKVMLTNLGSLERLEDRIVFTPHQIL